MAYTAAVLKQAGHDVHVIDSLTEGVGYKEFLDKIEKINPDFIFSETSTPSYNNDKKIIKDIKKKVYVKI